MAPIVLLALALTQTPAAPSVKLAGVQFVVEEAGVRATVPLKPEVAPEPQSVVFREGDVFAVWDVKRGLSIRRGEAITSTWLPEVTTSSRLFKPEQVAQNEQLIDSGERTPGASGLAGAARIKDTAYFLVQWRDKKKEPWLEVLVKVDLKDKKPIVEMVGRFDGFSTARSDLADALSGYEDRLMAVTTQGDAWGIARYAPRDRKFSYEIAGAHLSGSTGIGSRTVVVEERTAYGTSLFSRVYLPNGTRRNLLEVRGKAALVDTAEPLIALVNDSRGRSLRNLDTGAVLPLTGEVRAERTPMGILVASPPDKPTAALLYDPVRWERRALWSAGPTVSGGG